MPLLTNQRLEEQYQQAWAKDLKGLLCQMKAVTDRARAQGATHLPQAERNTFVARYDALLAAGLAANPPPERRPHQRGRIKQSPVRNLLERLWLGREEVLAFLDDLTIPFDNNQAERDLRMLRVQQKVSSCFRSDNGAVAFACLRGYLSTLRKQGYILLAALEALFTGQPLYPAFAWTVTKWAVIARTRNISKSRCGLWADRAVGADRAVAGGAGGGGALHSVNGLAIFALAAYAAVRAHQVVATHASVAAATRLATARTPEMVSA